MIIIIRDTSTSDDDIILAEINFQDSLDLNLENLQKSKDVQDRTLSEEDIQCTRKISKELDDGSQWRLKCSVIYR
jgi:hypothetical protein